MLTRIIDKDLYNAPRFKLQKIVFNRNRAFFENKLKINCLVNLTIYGIL